MYLRLIDILFIKIERVFNYIFISHIKAEA